MTNTIEITKKKVIFNSDIVVKILPGGVDHPEVMLFAASKNIAKAQMLPINEIKPPTKTLFIILSSHLNLSIFATLKVYHIPPITTNSRFFLS